MAASDVPRDGDLVVTRHAHSAVRYTLSVAPGDPQVTVGAKADALRLALRFSALQGVDVWYREDGDYELVGVNRRPEP